MSLNCAWEIVLGLLKCYKEARRIQIKFWRAGLFLCSFKNHYIVKIWFYIIFNFPLLFYLTLDASKCSQFLFQCLSTIRSIYIFCYWTCSRFPPALYFRGWGYILNHSVFYLSSNFDFFSFLLRMDFLVIKSTFRISLLSWRLTFNFILLLGFHFLP